MTKSILKHKIQTLTGRPVKTIEEEMQYKPRDPNEPSMDIDTLRHLAASLVLLACNELPAAAADPVPVPVPVPAPATVARGRKRGASGEAGPGAVAKCARADPEPEPAPTPVTNGKRRAASGRRSLAVTATPPVVTTPTRRGRRSLLDSSSGSVLSQSVTTCLGPANTGRPAMLSLKEESDNGDSSLVNPTPAMQALLSKKNPKKVVGPARDPTPPPPRPEFPGTEGAKVFLVAGEPLELRLARLTSALPLSAAFPGAALTVLHTPAAWTPTEVRGANGILKISNFCHPKILSF